MSKYKMAGDYVMNTAKAYVYVERLKGADRFRPR